MSIPYGDERMIDCRRAFRCGTEFPANVFETNLRNILSRSYREPRADLDFMEDARQLTAEIIRCQDLLSHPRIRRGE